MSIKSVRITNFANVDIDEDGTTLAVGVRDGQVVIVGYDDNDESQQWTQVFRDDDEIQRDDDGLPGFMLMNKETGQAIKHPIAAHEPLQLADSPSGIDYSFMWTKQYGPLQEIRQINNTGLCWDAFKGDSFVGAKIGVWESSGGNNQKWSVVDGDD